MPILLAFLLFFGLPFYAIYMLARWIAWVIGGRKSG